MQDEKPLINEKLDKPVASDKAKKTMAIILCFGIFAWISIFVTIPSVLFELLPKHYILYLLIISSAHIITYKISKKIMINYKSFELTDGNNWNDAANYNYNFPYNRYGNYQYNYLYDHIMATPYTYNPIHCGTPYYSPPGSDL